MLSRSRHSGGTFCCFYFNGVGEGSTQVSGQHRQLDDIEPEDSVYFQHSHGLRLLLRHRQPEVRPAQRLRLRRYDRSNGPFIGEQSPQVFPFTTGVPYLVAVTRKRHAS